MSPITTGNRNSPPVLRSNAAAESAKTRLVFQLRQVHTPQTQALAVILSGCGKAHRCRSAACPVCSLDFQQLAVGLTNDFIIGPAQNIRGRKSLITAIPSTGCVAPGSLTSDIWYDVVAEIKTMLASIGAGPSLGGTEASFNEDLTCAVPSHCCIHCHVIILDWLSKAQDDEFRATFPPHRLVKRPIMVSPLDGRHEGQLYPFKSDRSRRETYLDPSKNDREPHRNTRKRPLRPHQAVELALVEHEVGFRRRLVSHGIDVEAINRAFDAANWPRDGPYAVKMLRGNCT